MKNSSDKFTNFFSTIGFIVSLIVGFKGCNAILHNLAQDRAIYATFSSFLYQTWKLLAPLLFLIVTVFVGTTIFRWIGKLLDKLSIIGSSNSSPSKKETTIYEYKKYNASKITGLPEKEYLNTIQKKESIKKNGAFMI